MSSIRPLVTITLLFAVGAFMVWKINESPAPIAPGAEGMLESAPPVEVPPLATMPSAAPAAPTAPTWSDEATGGGEITPQWNDAPAENVAQNAPAAAVPLEQPAVPAVPELPPLAPAPEIAVTTAPATAAPIDLPANIPAAKYPGDAAMSDTTVAANAEPIPAAEPAAPSVTASSTTSLAADDRYGSSAAEPAATPSMQPAPTPSATPVTPAQPSFAAIWPEIQGALERQELVEAHAMLSQWYGNPALSPDEAQRVETLLGQLAGTVVYSTEHRLEPPYTVQSGDTLQTIAQKYEVPWQLLAKINGVPAAEMVQPGQQLKVVHGPFSAVVELNERQLTLLLDGRYAGRFPITVEPSAAKEGEWVLEQKLVNPPADAAGVVSASYAAPIAVDRVLVLRSESPTPGTTISITGGTPSPSGPTAIAPAAIQLSPTDAEEVADILSVGSRVTIRR